MSTDLEKIVFTKWCPIDDFKDQVMYTKSLYYDVANLNIEIESESPVNGFTIRIEFNKDLVSFRATQEPYLENFWNRHDVTWKQTFFIIEKSSRYDFIIDRNRPDRISSHILETGVHYAIYTYDVFFEIFSFEPPKVTIISNLTFNEV